MPKPLGCRPPADNAHLLAHPLTTATTPDKPTPVVLGIPWYDAFDRPKQDSKGRWWIRETNLGSIRGWHAICVKPGRLVDSPGWYPFYDQGQEGACVGFSSSRMMSLWNRVRYDARWLYKQAQLIDEYDDTPPGEGTSVRAAFEILRTKGAKRFNTGSVVPGDGISAYRWATSVEDVHAVIKTPLAVQLGGVPLLNSWGTDYPHIVWLPDPVLARLFSEQGEGAVATDR